MVPILAISRGQYAGLLWWRKGAGSVSLGPNALKKSLIKNRLNAIKGAFDEWSFQDIPPGSPNMTAQEFQDMLNNPGTPEPPNVFNATANTKTIRFRYNLIFVGGVDFYVTMTQNGAGYEFTTVTSDDWGAMLSSSWSQTSFQNYIIGNVYTVDAFGYRSYHIFIDGIGTFYKEYCHFRFKFYTNANPVSIEKIQ